VSVSKLPGKAVSGCLGAGCVAPGDRIEWFGFAGECRRAGRAGTRRQCCHGVAWRKHAVQGERITRGRMLAQGARRNRAGAAWRGGNRLGCCPESGRKQGSNKSSARGGPVPLPPANPIRGMIGAGVHGDFGDGPAIRTAADGTGAAAHVFIGPPGSGQGRRPSANG